MQPLRPWIHTIIAGALAALTCPAPVAALSQDTLRVGDVRVEGQRLRPYRRTARQIVTDANGTVLNARQVITDELHEITPGEGKRLRRTVTLHRFDGQPYAADTVHFDPATLQTLFTVERVAGTTAWRRRWDSLRVMGQRLSASMGGSGLGGQEGDPELALDATMPYPVFDYYGAMEGLLFAAFPLAEAAQGVIPIFDPYENRAAWLTYRVGGQEPVEAGPGRIRQAWLVETTIREGVTTAWVSPEPPYVLKTRTVVLRDGKPWRIYTVLMIEPQG